MTISRLETLQAFVRVAELRSFTQAADSLGLPKASVSTWVKQLETQLGTQLLHRSTRRVQLTPDGEEFYRRALDLLAELDDLEHSFRQAPGDLRGRLRVDMPRGIARNLVMPKLPDFLLQHPQLQMEISSTDRRVDPIAEGFDCVVRVGQLQDSALIARPIGQLSSVNCASPDYLARQGIPTSLDDLAQHQLVHYVPKLGSKSAGFEYCDQGEVKFIAMTGQVTVNDSDAYREATLAGFGIAQIPRVGALEELRAERLVEVLRQFTAAPMPVSLIYPNRRNQAHRVKIFMAWLSELLTSYVD